MVAIAAWPSCTPATHETSHQFPESPSPKSLDPAAWGADHVGQSHPEYLVGSECLFCHRNDVGSKWATNQHNATIRQATPDDPAVKALAENKLFAPFADAVELLIGGDRQIRFLKRSPAYGRLDLLASVSAQPNSDGSRTLIHASKPHWDADVFAASCAGCHATAVNVQRREFSAISLDCYTCHGNVPVEHANEPALMHFAKKRKDDPRVVTSICAQCHIRYGKSKHAGLPYPDTFVPGDNLFKDFQVDWALADSADVNPSDRHVLANVRDVVLYGQQQMTCLTCHEIHRDSTRRHRRQDESPYCFICHDPANIKNPIPPYEVHSERCGY